MLEYSDLSISRKKWVHLVELFHPEVDQTISYEQIKTFHEEFKEKRSLDTRFKVSLPLWIIGQNAISRGVYFFPGTKNDSAQFLSSKKEIDDMYETEYQSVLKQYALL